MKFYQTLAGIAVALAWNVAGAQTGMPNSSGTDSQAQPQQAPKNATEPQPDKVSVPANKDANPTQASTTTAHKTSGKTSAKKAHGAHHAKHSTQSKSAKSTKTAHSTDYAAKTKKPDRANPPEQTFTKDERDYRAALRQCAGERDHSARDSCLDGAIEQFRRNG